MYLLKIANVDEEVIAWINESYYLKSK